jgi:glucoamylase
LQLGKPTGSATPLMWAHAEYIKLLRSATEGKVFDLIPAVADRYRHRRNCSSLEIWKPNRHVRTVQSGMTLRIQVPSSFRLRWTVDEWQSVNDTTSTATALGIHYADIPVAASQRVPIRFTFFWSSAGHWEGRDFQVGIDVTESKGFQFKPIEDAVTHVPKEPSPPTRKIVQQTI